MRWRTVVVYGVTNTEQPNNESNDWCSRRVLSVEETAFNSADASCCLSLGEF